MEGKIVQLLESPTQQGRSVGQNKFNSTKKKAMKNKKLTLRKRTIACLNPQSNFFEGGMVSIHPTCTKAGH